MDDLRSGIPDSVKQLLHRSIFSVEQLESLLLLRNSSMNFSGALLAAKLYTSTTGAERTLEYLATQELLKVNEEGLYSYEPVSAELNEVVGQLEKLYKSRRVSIISTIYNRP